MVAWKDRECVGRLAFWKCKWRINHVVFIQTWAGENIADVRWYDTIVCTTIS